MNKFKITIQEVSNVLGKNGIKFALTRFDKDAKGDPGDLDILVPSNSFSKTIQVLEKNGYTSSSHDQALGGRIKDMQKNLTKPGRIKIDLHQDFTWKVSRYFDLDLVWKSLKTKSAQGISYPAPNGATDAFIVLVNILFEKTYLKKEDYSYIKESLNKILEDQTFVGQAKKYSWERSFSKFVGWFQPIDDKSTWPIFLPTTLIINTYAEKFLHEGKINITSLLYYVFFRIRFSLNGVLPYD